MKIKDRIKELRRVPAKDLAPNPRNWRTHPVQQRDALKGVLAEIGWAGAALARELEDGTLQLIDGHLRAETVPDGDIPVLILDVTEEEANLLLATYDPLTGMAEADSEILGKLLAGLSAEHEAIVTMLSGLAEDNGIDLFSDGAVVDDDRYTSKIAIPVYEPKGDKPPLSDLIDRSKTERLIANINTANIPEDVKIFLRLAAERHTAFHFGRIAEFYCHASQELQELMEQSGLVIIDFDKAIENGFVHLTDRLGKLADLEAAEFDDEE